MGPVFAERKGECFIVCCAGATACHDNNIEPCKRCLMVSEGFSGQTLDSVPVRRMANVALGDGEPKAWHLKAVASCKNRQIGVRGLGRFGKYPLESSRG